MVKKLTCQICQGVVRINAVMCGHCDIIFCECCMIDIQSNYEKNYVKENKGGLMAVYGSNGISSSTILPPLPCPMCKDPFDKQNLPQHLLN